MIKFKIDKGEVLRYLGHGGENIDDTTNELINECIEEVKVHMNEKFLFKIFDTEKSEENIYIKNTTLVFKGKDIYRHLENCEKCAIMAATLGNEIDKKIKYYSKVDLTRGVILDACATTAIEALCDDIEEGVKEIAKYEGYNITFRYSPGYGDFSTNIQTELIRVLNANRQIGLTVTDSLILVPRKSVTAIIGFQKGEVIHKTPKCSRCSNYGNCRYAKEGGQCGFK